MLAGAAGNVVTTFVNFATLGTLFPHAAVVYTNLTLSNAAAALLEKDTSITADVADVPFIYDALAPNVPTNDHK